MTMEIRTNKTNIKNNFKAIPLAKLKTNVNGIQKEIELYKLETEDSYFGKKLSRSIDLHELCPNEKFKYNLDEWKRIISNALENILCRDNVVLATQNKIPCGVIDYTAYKSDQYYISSLATWPVKPNQKAAFAGQALIYHIFNDSIKNDIKKVMLTPSDIKINGKSCVDFYKKLGFVSDGLFMNIENKENAIENSLKQMNSLFTIEKPTNSQLVDLCQILDVHFEESLFQKITKLIKETFKK